MFSRIHSSDPTSVLNRLFLWQHPTSPACFVKIASGMLTKSQTQKIQGEIITNTAVCQTHLFQNVSPVHQFGESKLCKWQVQARELWRGLEMLILAKKGKKQSTFPACNSLDYKAHKWE